MYQVQAKGLHWDPREYSRDMSLPFQSAQEFDVYTGVGVKR